MKLPINEAPVDRIIRVVLGILLAGFALSGAVVAPVIYVAWLVAAVLVVTGIVGFCPLYAALGVGTRRTAQ